MPEEKVSRKQEKDYTPEVDALIPTLEGLAKVSVVPNPHGSEDHDADLELKSTFVLSLRFYGWYACHE